MAKKMKTKKLWIGLGAIVIALVLATGVKAATSPVMVKPKKCNSDGTRNVLFVLTKKVGILVLPGGGWSGSAITVNQTKTLKLRSGLRYSWNTIPSDEYSPRSGSFFVKSCVSKPD